MTRRSRLWLTLLAIFGNQNFLPSKNSESTKNGLFATFPLPLSTMERKFFSPLGTLDIFFSANIRPKFKQTFFEVFGHQKLFVAHKRAKVI